MLIIKGDTPEKNLTFNTKAIDKIKYNVKKVEAIRLDGVSNSNLVIDI